MRLAVISDIHGNWAALEAVLADLKTVGTVDLTWCLGDVTFLGPRPQECTQQIKALAEADEGKKFKVIGGNTDRYLVTGERPKVPSVKDDEAFQKQRVDWRDFNNTVLWGVDQLDFSSYEFLAKINGRELGHEVEGYGYVIGYHAVPGDDETVLSPETSDEEARDLLLDREGRLALGGHIHRQFDRDLGNWRVVNVGSVGAPLDIRGQASWALLTFEKDQLTIDMRRVPFDVEAVIADMRSVGHPAVEWAAARLRPQE